MTDLRSAEEFANDIATAVTEDPEDSWDNITYAIEKAVSHRDGQIHRNALEAAARAVCWACAEGMPLDHRHKNQQAATVHVQDTRGYRVRCNAQPIRKLIPKDPPPA